MTAAAVFSFKPDTDVTGPTVQKDESTPIAGEVGRVQLITKRDFKRLICVFPLSSSNKKALSKNTESLYEVKK